MSSSNTNENVDTEAENDTTPDAQEEKSDSCESCETEHICVQPVDQSVPSELCSTAVSPEDTSNANKDVCNTTATSDEIAPKCEANDQNYLDNNSSVLDDEVRKIELILGQAAMGGKISAELDNEVKEIELILGRSTLCGKMSGVGKPPSCPAVDDKSVNIQKLKTVSMPSNRQIYRLKWIEWHSKKVPIVTQNENGPCPLIAIANILLLRGKIHLRPSMDLITSSELMDFIGDAIMESIPKDLKGPSMLNYEQNMHDAIAILPQLHTGLDVNIKFTGVQHFEYTPECIIFDLLNIPLYHGWLVDPQCHEVVNALGSCGYNQLVEKIILNKCSSNPDFVTEALIAEQFLERTASQLTYHGLCELNTAMKQEELAVLFRNNHFSTILKKKHELFQLVTDQGFLHESRVVWETLCNIEGDGQFVDSLFATVPPKSADGFIPESILTEEQQINQDYLVALSLQEEQKKLQDRDQAWQEYRETLCNSSELSDEELARRIQEEQQGNVQPSRAPSPSVSTSSRLPSSPGVERGRKGAVCIVI